MIRAISPFIDNALIDTGYLTKYFPLVELKPDGEITKPVYYTRNGNYTPMPNNLDNYNGVAYLRQNGNPSSSEDENPNVACGIQLRVNYPLRFVFCIPREKLPIDNAFAADMLVNDLLRILTGKNGQLKQSLSAVTAVLLPESWTTNSVEVLGEEYEGIKAVDVNYKFIYGAINFTANVLINKNCLPVMCEEPECNY